RAARTAIPTHSGHHSNVARGTEKYHVDVPRATTCNPTHVASPQRRNRSRTTVTTTPTSIATISARNIHAKPGDCVPPKAACQVRSKASHGTVNSRSQPSDCELSHLSTSPVHCCRYTDHASIGSAGRNNQPNPAHRNPWPRRVSAAPSAVSDGSGSSGF